MARAQRPATGRPRRPRRLGLLLLLAGLAFATLRFHEAFQDGTLPRPMSGGSKVWEVSTPRCVDGLYALAGEDEGSALYGPSGKIALLPEAPGQAVISDGTVYVTDGTSLNAYGPDGALTATRPVEPGERLLACSGLSGVLAFMPAGGAYGEQWMLRAVSASGTIAPRIPLPGVPSKAAKHGNLLYIGLRDIASGGLARLACARADSGSLLWTLPLDHGHWRAIIPARDGAILYATSQSAGMVGPDGGVLAIFPVRGEIWAATWEGVCVALCHGSSSRAFLTLYSQDGQVIWQHRLPSPAHSLLFREGVIVALCQTHVIGFSLRDGRKESFFATRDLPLAVGDGLVLFGKDSGAYLVRFDQSRTRIP